MNTESKKDPHTNDVDHGFDLRDLWQNVHDGIGYFGEKQQGVFLTFGWVMIVNTFFRNFVLLWLVMAFRDALSFGVGLIAMLFGAVGVGLSLYQPYRDFEITLIESLSMLMLALICFAACLKDFFQTHRMSAIYHYQTINNFNL